jgi:hypothetical protein
VHLDEQNRRTIARALYVIGALLIVIPLSDALPALWPPRPAEAEWRFGSVGLLSGALMTPLLGVFLALVAATVLAHRRVLVAAAYALLALAALLVIAAALFLLDFLEVRSRVQAAVRPAFLGAAAKAAWKMALGTAVLVALGLTARRIGRRLAVAAPPPAEPAPLVRAEPGG